QHHGGLGLAGAEHGTDWRELEESLDHAFGLCGNGQHVEVADGLAPAPEAARDLDALNRRGLLEVGKNLIRQFLCFGVLKPLDSLGLEACQRLKNPLLDLFSKAANRLQRARLGGTFQVRRVANLESLAEQAHSLGAEPRYSQQLEQSRRY